MSVQHTREDHKQMILDPFKWPHLVLPIKRYVDGMMETGVVYAGMDKLKEDEPIRIKNNTTIFGNLPGIQEIITYKNVDALLDDGWVVD
jgi:hypothetical protein